jgi:leader peptidase (prepilin peptidase)/N-methyltransferase
LIEPIALAGLTGLAVGSFLNVVIHRLPVRLGLVTPSHLDGPHADSALASHDPPGLVQPASHCPQCETPLNWRENIPLVSFIIQKGRCRHCNARISWRYPAVELLSALISMVVIIVLGNQWLTVPALLFSWALIVLAFIDIEHYLLPDAITLPLLWLGLLVNCFAGFTTPQAAIIGAGVGYLGLWLVYHLFRWITSREGFGYGDFKMLAAIGAWLGWALLPLVICIAAIVGAITGGLMMLISRSGRGRVLPFGPFLAGAAWLVLLFGDSFISAYLLTSGVGR